MGVSCQRDGYRLDGIDYCEGNGEATVLWMKYLHNRVKRPLGFFFLSKKNILQK